MADQQLPDIRARFVMDLTGLTKAQEGARGLGRHHALAGSGLGLAQHRGRDRVRPGVVIDVDVEPVHRVEVRIGAEQPKGPVAERCS